MKLVVAFYIFVVFCNFQVFIKSEIVEFPAENVKTRIIFLFQYSPNDFHKYLTYFVKFISSCDSCPDLEFELFFGNSTGMFFNSANITESINNLSYRFEKDFEIMKFQENLQSIGINSILHNFIDDFLNLPTNPLTKLNLIVISDFCPPNSEIFKRFNEFGQNQLSNVKVTQSFLITQSPHKNTTNCSQVDVIIDPKTNFDNIDLDQVKKLINQNLSYKLNLNKNFVNVFVIMGEKHMESFYDFFLKYVYNTPRCGLNTSLNAVEYNYYFKFQIRNTANPLERFRTGSAIIPFIDYEKYNIDFPQYFRYNIKNSLSEYLRHASHSEVYTQLADIFNDSVLEDSYQFNIVFVDYYFEWLNTLANLTGGHRKLDVFMFNELAMPTQETHYREQFFAAFDTLKSKLASFNLIGPNHKPTNIGLCQRRPNETLSESLEISSFTLSEDYIMVITFGFVTIVTVICLTLRCYCRYLKKKETHLKKFNEIQTVASKKKLMLSHVAKDLYLDEKNLQINFTKKLGSGMSSVVYPAAIRGKSPLFRKKKSYEASQFRDCVVAAKMLNNTHRAETFTSLWTCLAEVEAAKKLGQHENICTLLGWSLYGNQMCLLYEAMEQDLLGYLKSLRISIENANNPNEINSLGFQKESDFVFPEFCGNTKRIFLQIIRQATKALEYISSKKLIHSKREENFRDVAARNFLLAKQGNNFLVKLSDFGLSCCFNKKTKVYNSSFEKQIPIKWLSIEALTNRVFSESSDVWAFGITLVEIYTLGKEPYPDIHMNQMTKHLMSGERIKKPDSMDNEIYHIAFSCWNENPDKRPTFATLEKIFYQMILETQSGHYLSVVQQFYDIPP